MTTCALSLGEAIASSEMAIQMYTNLAENARKWVVGVTGLKPPVGWQRGNTSSEQAGAIGFDIATLPKFQPITGKLEWQPNDAEHSELSNRGLCALDYFQDMWIYARRNLADPTKNIIWIPNHVQFPKGGFSVSNFSLPEKGVNDKWTVDFGMMVNIQCITAVIHLFDGTVPDFKFTTGANDTITRTTGSFVTDGIRVGMKVFVDDEAALLTNYRKIVTVKTVAALIITCDETGYLSLDATGSATTVLRAGRQM